jgi:hypothetical protein
VLEPDRCTRLRPRRLRSLRRQPDLTSVIALLGLPCGQVVSVVHNGDNDNVATCKNAHRYHVFVNADGRVVAQKQ